jgi:hypothetical protein
MFGMLILKVEIWLANGVVSGFVLVRMYSTLEKVWDATRIG